MSNYLTNYNKGVSLNRKCLTPPINTNFAQCSAMVNQPRNTLKQADYATILDCCYNMCKQLNKKCNVATQQHVCNNLQNSCYDNCRLQDIEDPTIDFIRGQTQNDCYALCMPFPSNINCNTLCNTKKSGVWKNS